MIVHVSCREKTQSEDRKRSDSEDKNTDSSYDEILIWKIEGYIKTLNVNFNIFIKSGCFLVLAVCDDKNSF